MLNCTIGIMAYNEEKNIGFLLEKLLNQKLNQVSIDKIMVVASGCSDRTVPLVQELIKKYPDKLELIIESERRGKSSAINLFLKKATSPFIVLESADTQPLENTVECLVKPLDDEKIGMCGCQPQPQNNPNTFMGFTNHLLWRIHHLLSLERPKMGEMVAFRNIVPKIPETSAVDETSIEAFFAKSGFQIKYVPEAIIYNWGAENVKDFIKQRRRIYAGHSAIEYNDHYYVATLNGLKIFWLIAKNIKLNLKTFFWLWGAISLEIFGRFLGYWDYYFKKKNHAVWEIAKTTKEIKNCQ